MIKKKVSILLLLVLSATTVFAQLHEYSEPTYAEKIAALSKPATVQIETTIAITAKIPDIRIEQGRILQVGESKEREFNDRFTGSGFIITPEGYVVTNAHVVQAELEEMLPGFLQGLIANLGIQPEHHSQALAYLREKIEPKLTIKEIAVLLPITSQKGFDQLRIPADIRAQGKGYPGKDVAILKIPTQNLPTLNLGHIETPPVGAPILVIGYPAAAKIGPAINDATVTSGIVSAYKTADEGWKLMQIDAAISGGNSGGPVFDKQGHVIGIATLKSGRDSGFNWVVPNEVIQEFLNQANVKPKRGIIDNIYEKALNYYWQEKYAKAIIQFRHVLDIMPHHSLAPTYLLSSRIILEQETSGFSWTILLITLGFSLIGFTILLI
ncbi:trypsin-like peptidase domain-containing protein, partial [Candidatus Woesearchaeota archaeon]|nr:trypsin-like peptidase domain-containing protein [Candidatus Woesearchaeota archaeon]